jgi:hypothetical protein
MKFLRTLAILAIVFIPLFSIVGCAISQSNQEVELRNQFNQKITERTAFYDKMWKIISQKSQIALRNDSSFRQNINIIMEGRKDGQQVFFKWITETNPNANYSEVSVLYKDLSRAVEAEREGFFNQEKVLQDIKLQHDNLLSRFPSTIIMSMLGRHHLVYKPITSDRTDRVIESGKDNNTNVFE